MKHINTLKNNRSRNYPKMFVIAILVLLAFLFIAFVKKTEAQKNPVPQKTVVLVHGLFADGSGSWRKIIPMLQAKGLNVVAVQNPLTSIADDAAATKRAIDAAPGPVILVGHSWGGNAITQAGNNEKVAALVYIAAFAPSKNQSANELLKNYPSPEWFGSAIVDSGGVMTLPPDAISRFFAQDLPAAETSILAAAQAPAFVRSFDDKVTETAWSSKPSWYIVAANDRIISPEIERATAKKIGATVTVLQSSHVPMLSMPREVADVIFAAGGLSKK